MDFYDFSLNQPGFLELEPHSILVEKFLGLKKKTRYFAVNSIDNNLRINERIFAKLVSIGAVFSKAKTHSSFVSIGQIVFESIS